MFEVRLPKTGSLPRAAVNIFRVATGDVVRTRPDAARNALFTPERECEAWLRSLAICASIAVVRFSTQTK